MKSLVQYINEGKKENIKQEVEEYVKSLNSQVEEWITNNRFTDKHGCDGSIFKSEASARRSIISGDNRQNAIDYVNGAQTDEEWIDYLVKGGVDRKKAESIINKEQWGKVVNIIVDTDGPEWFLAQYSGSVHSLSNGYLLYY